MRYFDTTPKFLETRMKNKKKKKFLKRENHKQSYCDEGTFNY